MQRDEASAEPSRGYALCGEPRCGSTYLARLLASTGVLGHPQEYFAGGDRVRSANRDPETHLAEWTRRTATANGVYGLKIFARQFDLVEQSRWAVRLPRLHFVHIQRLDLLAQAVSLVRASQTLAFESNQAAQREPVYSRRSISSALARIAHNQARWTRWFARNGIEPLRLTYEEIVDRPHEAVRLIAERMGVAASLSRAEVGMEVQRDRLSEEWMQRFVSESRDLTFLDDTLWRIRPALRRLLPRL